MNSELLKRLGECQQLPTLPGVVFQLLELCRQEEASLQEAGDLIGSDPALAARVLQVVNSPFYGLRREVTSLRQACSLLGVWSLCSLALSFSLASNLRQSNSGSFDYRAYWQRSLLSAIAARTTAQWMKLSNGETLFLVALLQDIGMLALEKLYPHEYGELFAESGRDHLLLERLEREHLDATHVELGQYLADKWNFPELFSRSFEFSHERDRTTLQDLEPDLRCVSLSGHIADTWLREDHLEASSDAARVAESALDMKPQALQSILTEIAEVLPDVSIAFEINMGTPETTAYVLEQARQVLVERPAEAVPDFMKSPDLIESENRVLREQVYTDPLSGLYNRRYLDVALPRELQKASQLNQPLSLVFFDIDGFKAINDTYGHATGDLVVSGVARVIQEGLRHTDVAARYGGEEFIALLPATQTRGVEAISRRIVRQVAAQSFSGPAGTPVMVTISAGHATCFKPDQCTPESLLRVADEFLYVAKGQGGNQVFPATQGDLLGSNAQVCSERIH